MAENWPNVLKMSEYWTNDQNGLMTKKWTNDEKWTNDRKMSEYWTHDHNGLMTKNELMMKNGLMT